MIYLIHSLIVIHLIGLVLLEHINFIIIHSISKLRFNIFVCARFWTKSSYYLWFRTLFYFQPIKSEKISWPQIVLYKKILASYCCIVLRTCFLWHRKNSTFLGQVYFTFERTTVTNRFREIKCCYEFPF